MLILAACRPWNVKGYGLEKTIRIKDHATRLALHRRCYWGTCRLRMPPSLARKGGDIRANPCQQW